MKGLNFFLAVVFCVAVMGGVAQSQVITGDTFSYSTGQLTTVSSGAWVNFSGTGSFIQVTSPGLAFPNYPSLGNKIDIISVAGSAEDVHRQFATQTTGSTYAAFLVNVTNTTLLALNSSPNGDHFAGFLPSTSTANFASRVSIRLGSVASTYNLGLRASGILANSGVFSATNFAPGTTNLIVIRYQINAGVNDDVTGMWINPALGGAEPAADLSQISAGDNPDVARFYVRQGTMTTPNASIDGLRVGSTWSGVTFVPTAADGMVSGRIADASGAPIAGAVVRMSGSQTRKTITDASGYYHFDNVETNGFYTVAPSRTNFSFSPSERSFSQVGNSNEATFTGSPIAGENPLDTPEYLVRQHYLDFLGREPDESGFNFWSDQLLDCGNDAACFERRTVNVSAAYFLSTEFQRTGGLVERLYQASYGRSPLYAEFMPDSAAIARNLVVGRNGWQQQLAANEESFVAGWLDRAAFHAAFDNLSNDSYVAALVSNTGASYSQSERDSLVNGLSAGTLSRGQVLQRIANSESFAQARFNEAFVMMEYFGYLRRDPDPSGYAFWLDKLNQFGGNFERAEMVKAFIDSGEYRARFQR